MSDNPSNTSAKPMPTSEELVMALMKAAMEAYHNEVVLRNTESLIIGPKKQYADQQAWIDSRIEEWLYGGTTQRSPVVFGLKTQVVVRIAGEPERAAIIVGTEGSGDTLCYVCRTGNSTVKAHRDSVFQK